MAYDRIPIGRFSLITRLSQKALRLYDERGLLVPEVKDLCSGYRYYSGAQIARGVSIKTLCSLGFSPGEIGALLAAKTGHDTGTIREMFSKRRQEIRSEVRRLQQIEAILASEDASLELIYMSLNEPLVRDIPPQRIVGKKGTGPYGETISRLMPALCSQIFSDENQRNGLKITGPFMTLYYDSEYRGKDATMECVAPITGRIVLSDPEMEVRTLPGGKCLSLIHKGPYTGLHEAWARIGAYAEEREFVFNGLHREVYLTDPHVVPEEELLTELQIPIDADARRPGD
ncbi:MAG TPA: MerR family transcriptional regulator [Methanoregula sp.]|nr:MerR family transcriptional regulator [Methanoregula sp.]